MCLSVVPVGAVVLQEVVRMQSLVECVNTIYPTAALHILKLQPGFNFRQRGLTPVAQVRSRQRLTGHTRPADRHPPPSLLHSSAWSRAARSRPRRSASTARSRRPWTDGAPSGQSVSQSARALLPPLLTGGRASRRLTPCLLVCGCRQANGSLPSSTSTPSSGSSGSSGSGAERSSRSEDGQAAAQQQQQPPAASQLLLPERIKWALSVTDFRPLLEAGQLSASSTTDLQGLDESSNGGEQGGNGEGPGELLLSATRLYGVFEFMRTGERAEKAGDQIAALN